MLFKLLNYILAFLILLGPSLQIFSKANVVTDGNFTKWLEILNGVRSSKTSNNDNSLENINKSINEWQSKGPKYAAKIPAKLKSISKIDSETCSKKLEEILEPDLTKNGDWKNFSEKYFQFYGKMQFNLCLQDMDLKRAQKAALVMNKGKWMVWYYAFTSHNNSKLDKDLQESSKRLANYLKRYAPQIDIGSPDEQMAKIEMEIKSILDAVCPWITKKALRSSVLVENLEYLDRSRAAAKADPESYIWSNSKALCFDEKLQSELMKSVGNFMINELKSVKVKDEIIHKISDPQLITNVLFSTDKEKSSPTIMRAGNQIELLVQLSQLTGKSQEQAKELLELRNISVDKEVCNLQNIAKWDKLNRDFSSNQVLGIYVSSMIALQYHVCDQIARFEAATLAINIKPFYLARLEELRNIMMRVQNQKGSKTSPFLDPAIGFGYGVKSYLNRFMNLDSIYSNEKSNNSSSNNDNKVRKIYDDYVTKTCVGLLEKLPFERVKLAQSLHALEKNGQIGESTLRLFDYSSICNRNLNEDGFKDMITSLEQK